MKLYELGTQYKELANIEDIPEDQIKDTLDLIKGDFKEKSVSIVAVKENMQIAVDGIDKEIKRLQEMKKVIQNKQNKLIDYLRYNMQESGITKIESTKAPFFSITLRKPSKKIVIDDESAIPNDYKKPVTTIKIDRRALLKDAKEKEIPGVHLEDGKASVIIK